MGKTTKENPGATIDGVGFNRVQVGGGLLGGGSTNFAASGENDSSGMTTQDWMIHIQNVEVMYQRETQYDSTDGSVDFNYLDTNYTMEASREHIYATFSGAYYQPQKIDLISNSASGGLGTCGVIRTNELGYIRRAVRTGDVEQQQRKNGNVTACRFPGAYNAYFDTSDTAPGTIMDILVAAKGQGTDLFELNLLDL